jgi:hypothetical protein
MLTAGFVETYYFPPPSQSPDPHKLRQHIDDFLMYQHEMRARDVRTFRRAEFYDQGIQWLLRAQSASDFGNLYTQWVPIYWTDPNDPNNLPTPVFNEGIRPRQNESARLSRPEYKPHVRQKGDPNDFTAKLGAKTMERSLLYALEEMEWKKQEELLYYHMPVYGGAWLVSEWVATYDKIVHVPTPVGMQCPGPDCDYKLASPVLTKDQVGILAGQVGGPPPLPDFTEGSGAWDRFVGSIRKGLGFQTPSLEGVKNEAGIGATAPAFSENAFTPLGDQGKEDSIVRAEACPNCGQTLAPFKPTMEEAKSTSDAVGRPMGRGIPLGDWKLRVASPYDLFPKNLGLNMRPGFVNEWVESHVETLEWIAERWPDKVNDVTPERPERLTEFHPVSGAPDLYAGMYQGKLFKASTRVKEYHRQPSMYPTVSPKGEIQWRYDKGRSCIMAGDTVLLDGDMMLPSMNQPGEFVPRVLIDYIPWELRDGGRRLQGLSQWELMFDPQDTINLGKSQTAAVQERIAVPFYLSSRQHNLQAVARRSGTPGMWMELDVDPVAPTFIPQLINNSTIDPGVAQAIAAAGDFINRASGMVEVEQGQTPPNVSAAYAIQVLKQSAGEGRAPRIRRIKESLGRAWGHGAQLMAAFYSPLERREIRYHDDATDEDVWSTVSALDFQGQTDVEVEGELDLDEDAEVGERIRDAVQLGIVQPASSPHMQRAVARMLKLPKELWEDENMQEAAAQREFLGFRDNGKVPVVDPTLDDNLTHYQVHGRSAHSPWFRQLEVVGGWDEVLLILGADWEQSLKQLLTMPPFEAEVIQAFMQAAQQAQMLGMPPPQPPPPETLQVRILKMWQKKLMMAQFTPPQPDALNRVMNWRAHVEAHKLAEEQKQMPPPSPMGVGAVGAGGSLAAPGAAAGPSGMQPTPGAPPTQEPAPEAVGT